MTQASPTPGEIPRAAVRGVASGVLFMAFFGTLWSSIGAGGLQGWGAPWLSIVAVLIGVALGIGGIIQFYGSRQLGTRIDEADAQPWRKTGIWFGIVFTLEGVSIGIASAICNATGHFDLFFPIMAIIAGVHFFPLAPLFQVRSHYLTGALLCLVAIITLLVVPARVTIGNREIIAWWTVVGFGCALILWTTGLALWLQGQRLLHLALKSSR
jgi:hypothetical protein